MQKSNSLLDLPNLVQNNIHQHLQPKNVVLLLQLAPHQLRKLTIVLHQTNQTRNLTPKLLVYQKLNRSPLLHRISTLDLNKIQNLINLPSQLVQLLMNLSHNRKTLVEINHIHIRYPLHTTLQLPNLLHNQIVTLLLLASQVTQLISNLPHKTIHLTLSTLRQLLQVEQINITRLIVPQLHLVNSLQNRLQLLHLLLQHSLVKQHVLVTTLVTAQKFTNTPSTYVHLSVCR